jgi:hypothetical protein
MLLGQKQMAREQKATANTLGGLYHTELGTYAPNHFRVIHTNTHTYI